MLLPWDCGAVRTFESRRRGRVCAGCVCDGIMLSCEESIDRSTDAIQYITERLRSVNQEASGVQNMPTPGRGVTLSVYERLPDIQPPCVDCEKDWYVERHVNCREYCEAWRRWVEEQKQNTSVDCENATRINLDSQNDAENEPRKKRAKNG
jgi:hypothetical protein